MRVMALDVGELYELDTAQVAKVVVTQITKLEEFGRMLQRAEGSLESFQSYPAQPRCRRRAGDGEQTP